MIRTVVAVTDPLVAAGPKALTQSPTARSVDAAVWVALTVVELDVVILSVSVLGAAGFFVFDEDFVVGRVNDPGLMLIPDTVTVDPLTPVTLPEAMAMLASALRKLDDPPPPKLGRVPPSAPAPCTGTAGTASPEAPAAGKSTAGAPGRGAGATAQRARSG